MAYDWRAEASRVEAMSNALYEMNLKKAREQDMAHDETTHPSKESS